MCFWFKNILDTETYCLVLNFFKKDKNRRTPICIISSGNSLISISKLIDIINKRRNGKKSCEVLTGELTVNYKTDYYRLDKRLFGYYDKRGNRVI